MKRIEYIVMTEKALTGLLVAAARMGAQEIRRYDDPDRDRISQNKAFKHFGRAQVERWISESRIGRLYIGSRLYLSMTELIAAQEAQRTTPELAMAQFDAMQQQRNARRQAAPRDAKADPFGGFTFGGERKVER